MVKFKVTAEKVTIKVSSVLRSRAEKRKERRRRRRRILWTSFESLWLTWINRKINLSFAVVRPLNEIPEGF